LRSSSLVWDVSEGKRDKVLESFVVGEVKLVLGGGARFGWGGGC